MNICIVTPRYPYKDKMEFVFVKKLVERKSFFVKKFCDRKSFFAKKLVG